MGQRILISTTEYLGDTIMTLPLIDLLEANYDDVRYMAPGYAAQLLASPKRKFVTPPPKSSFWGDIQYAKSLRAEQFDTAIAAKTSFRTAWILRLAKIPRRIGHAMEGRGFLLTDPVKYEPGAYFAFTLLDLARPFGLPINFKFPSFRNFTKIEEAKQLLDGATVAVQPGSKMERKMMSNDQLGAIIHYLADQGARVALIGGPTETEIAESLIAELKCPVVNLVGKTDFPTLASVLSQSKLVVGGDTGVLHLAAATGATTVQVFGPTFYKAWGNGYGGNQVLVAHDGNVRSLPADLLVQTVATALDAAERKALLATAR
ncbi:MAG: glycosyltransferase family 9 protein [Armatimonadetes bacterium]|nr:glycosyltransferase family 9 protein [Armatimonadota bacterium]